MPSPKQSEAEETSRNSLDVPLRKRPEVLYRYSSFSDSSPNEQACQKSNNSAKITPNVKTRWSKEKDIEMYKQFYRKMRSYGYTIEDFKNNKEKLTKRKRKFLRELKATSGWKCTYQELYKRICRVLTTTHFTARDERRLRRLLRQEIKGKITLERVLEHFPGKTMEQIVKFKEDVFTGGNAGERS